MTTIDETQGDLYRQVCSAASMVKLVMGVSNGCAIQIMLRTFSEVSGKATDHKTGSAQTRSPSLSSSR